MEGGRAVGGGGGGDLRPAVAVDVHGVKAVEGGNLPGDPGGLGEDDVGQLPVPQGQDVGDRAGLFRHPGDKEGRRAALQGPGGQAALLAQLRHGDGDAGRGLGRQGPLPPVVAVGHAVPLLVGVEDHQLPEAVAVQVDAGVADIADAAQQLLGPGGVQGVNREGLELGVDPPAHDDLRPPVPVQVRVDHAIDGRAAALDDGGLLIAVLLGGEDIDFQGLFVLRLAEEGDGLLLPVSVQVRQLHGLDVGAGRGGGVLRAVLQNGVEPGVQLRVLGGQLRQGVKLLGVELEVEPAAAAQGQRQQQRRRQGPYFFCHSAASLAA